MSIQYDWTSFGMKTIHSLTDSTYKAMDKFVEEADRGGLSLNNILANLIAGKTYVAMQNFDDISCRESLLSYMNGYYYRAQLAWDCGYLMFHHICCHGDRDKETGMILNRLSPDNKKTYTGLLSLLLSKLCNGSSSVGEVKTNIDEDGGIVLVIKMSAATHPIRISAALLFIRLFPILYKIDPSMSFLTMNNEHLYSFITSNISKITNKDHDITLTPDTCIIYAIFLYINNSVSLNCGHNYGSDGPISYVSNAMNVNSWKNVIKFAISSKTLKLLDTLDFITNLELARLTK